MSRTKKAIGNILTATLSDTVSQVLKFIVRTVFINALGTSYLGINGLFTNLLSMLSLAELGIGSAINFNLYQSLHDNDQRRTNQLMKFYKLVYFIIGLVILLAGIVLIPFLPRLISDYRRLEELGINAVLIYFLYLGQTVSSYWFFAYKSAIIKADQKEYRINLVSTVSTMVVSILQIATLYLTRSFVIYTLLLVLSVIAQNAVVALMAKRMYPYINEKDAAGLDKEEVISMLKDCGAVFVYKINSVVVNATDNIVLSSFVGLSIVGLYSNYLMAVTLIKSIANKFYNAITAGFGNLHAEGNVEHEYRVFKIINYITFVMYSVAAVWMCCCVNDFIQVWLRNPDLVVKNFVFAGKSVYAPIHILLGIEVYLFGMYSFLSRIRNAMGLFREIMISPVISMILNLAVSLLLVTQIGIAGVIVGTIVSSLCTYMWIDPVIMLKKVFHKRVWPYFGRNLLYIAVSVAEFFICKTILAPIDLTGWAGLILRTVICAAVTCTLSVVLFIRTKECRYLVALLKRMFMSILNKRAEVVK